LQIIDDFSSDHAQQVGQQTATAIAHSWQKDAVVQAPGAEGATAVTTSIQRSVGTIGTATLSPARATLAGVKRSGSRPMAGSV
jgi:hypothetical protein